MLTVFDKMIDCFGSMLIFSLLIWKEETLSWLYFNTFNWAGTVRNFKPQTVKIASTVLMSAGHTTTAQWILFECFFVSSYFPFLMYKTSLCHVQIPERLGLELSRGCPLQIQIAVGKRLWIVIGCPGRERRGFPIRWSAIWWCRTPGWPQTRRPLCSRLERRRIRLQAGQMNSEIRWKRWHVQILTMIRKKLT